MKPTICLRSGIEFDFIDPKPEMIKLSDIVHTLPYIVRFGAHCEPTVSVGFHTLIVYQLLLDWGVVDKYILLQGLLHDAVETYVGDMTAPLKMLIPEYKVIEERIAGVISEALGVDVVNLPKVVEEADVVARQIEQYHWMPDTDWWPKIPIEGWTSYIPLHSPQENRRLLVLKLLENKPEWKDLL